MNLKSLSAVVGATFLLGSAGIGIDRAAATTVQFASPNWTYNNPESAQQPNWLVAIDDDTVDVFRVKLSIASPMSPTGDMLGFGFDTQLTGLRREDVDFVSSSTGEGITGFFTDALSCGPGCNFNGGGRSAFDYIVRMGSQGSSAGLITEFEFTIANLAGIALTDAFSRVGIRAQSVGGSGSTKDINSTMEVPHPIPLPAALPLFLAGLAGLGLIGWRKRRASQAAEAGGGLGAP